MDERDAKHRYWIEKYRTGKREYLDKLFKDTEDLRYFIVRECIVSREGEYYDNAVMDSILATMKSIEYFRLFSYECSWTTYMAKCIRWKIYRHNQYRKKEVTTYATLDAPISGLYGSFEEEDNNLTSEYSTEDLILSQNKVDRFRSTLSQVHNQTLEELYLGRTYREIGDLKGCTYQNIALQIRQMRKKWTEFNQGEPE